MRVARVAAQAKINLCLKVLSGPDPTGYHGISTLFQRIDLADEVVVRAGDGKERSLVCAGPRVPAGGLGPEKKNLAFRAAEEYHAHTRWPRGFSIELTKNIPVGGGLGGGSADAGAVLRALDAMAPDPIGSEELQRIGATLGADVAFFASEFATAIGVGRGDQLLKIPVPIPEAEVLLLVPPFGVSTKDAYRWLDEARPPDPGRVPWRGDAWASPWEFLSSGNDFEPVVEKRHPELGEYRARLTSLGAKLARLSGSGSTVFGLFEGPVPLARDLAVDAFVIPTRTSARVVQVEVLE